MDRIPTTLAQDVIAAALPGTAAVSDLLATTGEHRSDSISRSAFLGLLSRLSVLAEGPESNVRDVVEARMLADLHEGTLSMDRIARDLGMSRQTLYRRLRDKGTTFAEVHDDLRRRMAMDYLSTRRLPVGETAYLLGFSEASAFVRAFKRWTGVSPTAWRAAA